MLHPQYIVLEGLAESFAGELLDKDKVGPWVQLPTEADNELARTRIGESLEVTGFNEIRGYIFGDWAAADSGYAPKGLPDFAGYSIGYQVVQNPTSSAQAAPPPKPPTPPGAK